MKLIGITGKTGTGKSTIAKILAQNLNGIYVDIDKIGHKATSDPNITKKLCSIFGNSLLDNNWNIDRKKLGNIVFSDTNKMQILTDITWEYMEHELDKILLQKQPFFIFDWALLPKVKYWNMCNIKILVTSDDTMRKERTLKRDHITPKYLEKRESATLDYSKLSFDFTFDNDYSQKTMNTFVEIIYNKVVKEDNQVEDNS